MKQLTLLECSKRRLDQTHLIVYAIKNEINIKKAVYCTIGIDMYGLKEILGL